jgi:hypothetical protein
MPPIETKIPSKRSKSYVAEQNKKLKEVTLDLIQVIREKALV